MFGRYGNGRGPRRFGCCTKLDFCSWYLISSDRRLFFISSILWAAIEDVNECGIHVELSYDKFSFPVSKCVIFSKSMDNSSFDIISAIRSMLEESSSSDPYNRFSS